MATSIVNLAPPELVKKSIIDINESTESGAASDTQQTLPNDEKHSDSQLKNSCSISKDNQPVSSSTCSANGSVSTGDLIECHHWLQRWLDSVVGQTLPKFLDKSQSSPTRVRNLASTLGLPTRLACAIYHYAPRLVNWEREPIEVCLDHYGSVLLHDSANLPNELREGLLQDDLKNGINVVRFLRALLATFKQSPIPSFHLIEQLASDPRVRSLTPAQELRLIAEFYHWLSAPASVPSTELRLPPAASSSALQNGILRNLVRNSGIVARPARPAHPSNRPFALLNTSTVEQLVVSSSSGDTPTPTDTVVREAETTTTTTAVSSDPNGTTSPTVTTACSPNVRMNAETEPADTLLADLARVASGDSKQPGAPGSAESPHSGYFVAQRTDPTSTAPVDSSSLTRNNRYATFCKRPTPSLSAKLPVIGGPTRKPITSTTFASTNNRSVDGLGAARSTQFSSPQHRPTPVSGIPSLRSEFEKRCRSRSTVGSNLPVGAADGPNTARNQNSSLPHGTTTWAASTGGARQPSRRSTDVPDSTVDTAISSTNGTDSKVPMSRSAVAALRLSLDQRRRAIEVGRQRTAVMKNQVASQRHHAAFQKLLQSEQRRRAKKEKEADTSDVESQSTAAVSRSDGDHMISSSAVNEDIEGLTQLNGSELCEADQSAVSASQQEQITDVDEDFSMHSTDMVTGHAQSPPTEQNRISEDGSPPPEHQPPKPDLPQTTAPSDELSHHFSPKELSPAPLDTSSPSNPTSDLAKPAQHTCAQSNRSTGSSPQEPDQSSSEAMDYLVSVASEQPIRSTSPAVDAWYRTMPQRRRHLSSGDTNQTTPRQQRVPSPAVEERLPAAAPSMKPRGSNHAVRDIPQSQHPTNATGPSASYHSPHVRRRRQQPQYSAAAYRQQDLTSQSLSIEPQDSQLLTNQPHWRGSRRPRHVGGANSLAASVNYEYNGRMAGSVNQEWDEPGDDEFEDEALSESDGIYGRVPRVNGSYVDDENVEYEELEDGGRCRVVYNYDDGSYSDYEDHSQPRRPWRGMDRFSSERRSVAHSLSGRQSNNPNYRKQDLLRASYDPGSVRQRRSPRPLPTEAALVDAETLDRLNRNLLELQSGLERLSAQQQQVLLASSSAAAALVAGAQSQHALVHPKLPTFPPAPQSTQPVPVTVQPVSPAGLTRATWSDRPKLVELTQNQDQLAYSESGVNDGARAPLGSESERSTQSHSVPASETDGSTAQSTSQAFFVDFNAPERSPSPIKSKAPDAPALQSTPPPEEKPKDVAKTEKAPAGQVFFIGFDEPDPQSDLLLNSQSLMQRKCDRLEARRAAEKAMAAQQLEALRCSVREEKHSTELAELERKTTEKERREAILQAYLNRKEQSESQCHRLHNPYPVRPGSAALSRSSGNLSTKSGKRLASQNTPTTTLPRNARSGDLRASRTGTLRAKSATRKQLTAMESSTSSSTTAARGNADGEATEAEEKQEPRVGKSTQKQQRSNGKPNGQMTSGLSLSSLHRLGAADQPTSGPGLPVSALSQPKLFVKPKAKSNRMVIVNAIGHCCLAGAVNEPMKQATLKELASTEGTHFMILFRDARCQYRAVYAYDLELEELRLICGTGPRRITHDMANRFFKYNSGSKQFTEITSTNHLSPVVDAITIHDALWSKSGAQAAAMNLISGRPTS